MFTRYSAPRQWRTKCRSTQLLREARLHSEPAEFRPNTDDVLGDRDPVPGRSPRQPRVLGLAVAGRIPAGDHLCVDVWLGPVQPGDLLPECRGDLLPVLVRLLGASKPSGGDHHPWVGVAEHTAVLLVAGWIGGDLTELGVERGEGGLVEQDAVVRVEPRVDRVECAVGVCRLFADAGHHAHALGLDEDLSFRVLARSNRVPEVVIGPEEPVAVPAMGHNRVGHLRNVFRRRCCDVGETVSCGHICVLLAGVDEQSGDEHRFCRSAVLCLHRLEGLSRFCRERVQVEAVVPVCSSDQRQTMRSQMVEHVMEGAGEVLEQGCAVVGIVVERDRLVED